jgi:hypothetical protein
LYPANTTDQFSVSLDTYSAAMSLKSDVNVDATKFDRKNIDKETLEFNEKLIKIWADGPRWYEVCYSRCSLVV